METLSLTPESKAMILLNLQFILHAYHSLGEELSEKDKESCAEVVSLRDRLLASGDSLDVSEQEMRIIYASNEAFRIFGGM